MKQDTAESGSDRIARLNCYLKFEATRTLMAELCRIGIIIVDKVEHNSDHEFVYV